MLFFTFKHLHRGCDMACTAEQTHVHLACGYMARDNSACMSCDLPQSAPSTWNRELMKLRKEIFPFEGPMSLHLSTPAFHQSGRQAFHRRLRKKTIWSTYPAPTTWFKATAPPCYISLPTNLWTWGSSKITRELSSKSHQRCIPQE